MFLQYNFIRTDILLWRDTGKAQVQLVILMMAPFHLGLSVSQHKQYHRPVHQNGIQP